jgi:hypothetical protein
MMVHPLAVAAVMLALLVPAADPRTEQSSPKKSGAVRILVDEGHHNFHTSTSGYAAFARLLRQNGFIVAPLGTRITADALAGADVFISASALPEPRATLVQKAREAGEQFEWSASASKPAYSAEEISAVQTWVRSGGSLLLVVDHAPNGGAGRPLAAAFGIDVRNAFTVDSAFQTATAMVPNAGHFLFTRGGGLLGAHPVLTDVDKVITYTGTSLQGVSDIAVLLRLPSTAVDRVWNAGLKQFERITAAGRAQAVALEYGRGRMIVVAEAGMLTTNPGSNSDYCGTRGIAQSDIGNRRFALNMVRWLARGKVQEGEAVAFVNSGCVAPPTLTLEIVGAAGAFGPFLGRWTAGRLNLQAAVSIDLKLDGARVEGNLTAGTQNVPILAGSVNGNQITFSVKSPNGARTITFTGSLAGNEISFTREVDVPPGGAPGGTGIFGVGGPRTFVAVRER